MAQQPSARIFTITFHKNWKVKISDLTTWSIIPENAYNLTTLLTNSSIRAQLLTTLRTSFITPPTVIYDTTPLPSNPSANPDNDYNGMLMDRLYRVLRGLIYPENYVPADRIADDIENFCKSVRVSEVQAALRAQEAAAQVVSSQPPARLNAEATAFKPAARLSPQAEASGSAGASVQASRIAPSPGEAQEAVSLPPYKAPIYKLSEPSFGGSEKAPTSGDATSISHQATAAAVEAAKQAGQVIMPAGPPGEINRAHNLFSAEASGKQPVCKAAIQPTIVGSTSREAAGSSPQLPAQHSDFWGGKPRPIERQRSLEELAAEFTPAFLRRSPAAVERESVPAAELSTASAGDPASNAAGSRMEHQDSGEPAEEPATSPRRSAAANEQKPVTTASTRSASAGDPDASDLERRDSGQSEASSPSSPEPLLTPERNPSLGWGWHPLQEPEYFLDALELRRRRWRREWAEREVQRSKCARRIGVELLVAMDEAATGVDWRRPVPEGGRVY